MGTVAEDYKEEYPGLPTYLQCQSSAFVSGTIALFMAGTGTYFAQGMVVGRFLFAFTSKTYVILVYLQLSSFSPDMISRFLPWTKKAFILPSIAVGRYERMLVVIWLTARNLCIAFS